MISRCVVLVVLLLGPVLPLASQATAGAARPVVAVLNLRFEGRYANVLEPGDTAIVQSATSKLFATLRASDRITLVDSARVADAVAAEAGWNLCGNACALVVARQLGAQWIVKGTVTKTSNIVWVLAADLLDVATGRPVLTDGYELKGDARAMAPAGARVLAQRIERTVAEHTPPVGAP
ncbi:MAG TPA: DUF2380 domain-containing protein [Gemmatimonadales bacterium]|nr:DUF2380 domain-containing protein [Gemmatimonadales bacterium]